MSDTANATACGVLLADVSVDDGSLVETCTFVVYDKIVVLGDKVVGSDGEVVLLGGEKIVVDWDMVVFKDGVVLKEVLVAEQEDRVVGDSVNMFSARLTLSTIGKR